MIDKANLSGKDYLILLLGILGYVLFFYFYPQQHPLHLADTTLSSDEIRQRASTILAENGYSTDGVVQEMKLTAQQHVLDAYQKEYDRQGGLQKLAQDSLTLPDYIWSVKIDPQAGVLPADRSSSRQVILAGNNDYEQLSNSIGLLFSESGQWVGFNNQREMTPKITIQRDALGSMLKQRWASSTQEDRLDIDPLRAINDSLLYRLIYFDLEQKGKDTDRTVDLGEAVQQLQDRLLSGMPLQLSQKDAARLARYHLDQSIWGRFDTQVDTMYIERINNINAARVYFSVSEIPTDLELNLQVDIAPTGVLLGLKPLYQNSTESQKAQLYSMIWQVLQVVLLVSVGILVLVVFYRRMKARVIDTKGALWLAMVGGLLLAMQILLALLGDMVPEQNSIGEFMLVIGAAVSIFGTLGMLITFVLFGAGESITRQYWSEKLLVSDLIRRGSWLNIPLGTTLIRSVCLSGGFLGIWVLLLKAMPQIWLSPQFQGIPTFLDNMVALSPLYVIAKQGFWVFIMVGFGLLTVGGLVQSKWNNPWITGFATLLLLMMIPQDFIVIKPVWGNILFAVAFAAFIVTVFMRWEIITAAGTYFLASFHLAAVSGWIVQGPSEDIWVFVTLIGITGLFLVMGFIGLIRGETEQSLPRYIPEYVDELAQEERIKQELQIAKRVQTSFLPVETPNINGFDVAGTCHPANETGGDYYDFIQLDDHRMAVVIGDVSGKGIQAAFYMTFIKGVLHSLCREVENPAELLCKANTLFYENARKGTFISMVYGILDTHKKTFTFARGGHNPILLKRAGQENVEELIPRGLALGMTTTHQFEERVEFVELQLQTDDVILLYTDGLVEMIDSEGKFYGLNRVKYIMKKRAKGTSLNMVNALNNDVYRFMGDQPQHDDLTLVSIKVG
jgi:hypothetical protein